METGAIISQKGLHVLYSVPQNISHVVQLKEILLFVIGFPVKRKDRLGPDVQRTLFYRPGENVQHGGLVLSHFDCVLLQL